MPDNFLEIYSIPTCSDCKEAKQFLMHHSIPYTDHNIDEHPEKMDHLIKLTGKHIVPTLIIDKKVFIGFAANRTEIEKLLL